MRQLISGLKAEAVIERVRTNSVLNSLLWLCGVVDILAIPAAFFSKGVAQIFFSTLAGLPVLATVCAYFIWMFLSPNRLQSEEYQLAQQKILQGSKEQNTFPITINSPTSDHPPRQITTEEALAPDEPLALSSGDGISDQQGDN